MTGRPDDGEPDGPLDIEARFADIVAHFDDDPPELVALDPHGPGGPRPADDEADGERPADEVGRPAAPEADQPGGRPHGSTDPGPVPAADGPAGPQEAGPAPPARGETARPAAGGPGAPGDGAPADETGRRRAPGGDEASERTGRGQGPALVGPPPLEPVVETEAERRARIEREVDAAVDGPDGGHYVPPEPPPVPRQDLPTRLAWLAVLLGPVLLLVAAMVWRGIPDWLVAAIVVGIIAGFGVLVSRLPRSRDDDDPDDGARV